MKQTLAITRKELDGYFSSPMALIFVGVFLVITLFTFFWIDGFFARGIADVRSLFRWMPLLMIFLVSALTMRQWSEEEQTGTLQVLLTMPTRVIQLVMGKFLAVLILVIVALLMTIFLPISVSLNGNLDWGPVIGGYLASVLMASAYIAIGLFVSSRTDNQLVSLTVTAIVCGLLHLVGSSTITNLVSTSVAEILRAFGTGSRFESIERGVLDIRDLVYYVSLTMSFLALNVLSLDSKRWSQGQETRSYRQNGIITALLVALNLVAFNVLLFPVNTVRADFTASGEYTLAPVTREVLSNIQEPLLIRGYFSEENHPFLAPLVPQIQDMLDEYRVAAGGNIQVEYVDPIENPEIEAEANSIYGIRPTPLQSTERGGVSVLNVYFDILIRYGDQTVTLNFGDLIEVNQNNTELEVRLRNLEYDLTSSIQKVVFGFQNLDTILASLDEPARATLYYTPTSLPEDLREVPTTIATVAAEIESRSGGKFVYQALDVNDPASGVTPQALANLDIQPLAVGFFSPDSFYLHIVVESGDQLQVIYPSSGLSENEIRTAIETALKRTSSGFLQVVGVWTPPVTPRTDQFGRELPNLRTYNALLDILSQNYEVRQLDLSTGTIASDIDVVIIIAPQNMDDVARYAIDQHLMRGGSVFVAAGSQLLTLDPMTGSLTLEPAIDGLQEMLAHYGVTVSSELVMDEQNEPFPVQTQRNIGGGMMINEIQRINYPFFVDVRPNAMDRNNPMVTGIAAMTVNFASPLTLDDTKNAERTISRVLTSTDRAWLTTNTNIQPDLQNFPDLGFPIEGEQTSRLLGVAITGSFDSYFADRESPFAADSPATSAQTGKLDQSPNNARLVVIGSAEFLNDNIFQISSSISGNQFLNTLQFMQNTVDWFVEDTGLATIRARGTTSRVLNPLTEAEQSRWELLNYGVAIFALIVLGVIWRLRKRAEQPMELVMPQSAA